MPISLICFDQDGVLADFVGGFKKTFNLDRDWEPTQYYLEKDIGITTEEMWDKINMVDDWWLKLNPIWEGIYLLKWCLSLKIPTMIATAPPLDNPDVSRQKLLWLKEYVPEQKKYSVITDKYYLSKQNRILIDDSEENIEKWENLEINDNNVGIGLLVKQPYNNGISFTEIKQKIIKMMKG